MRLPDTRCVLHLDADAFFASVEQRDDAKLRGRPVAVGSGVVASCSYEARRFGVHTGQRLAEARRLCRRLIVLPGSYPRYEQSARRMLGICADHTPQIEVAALDDLYLDVTQQLLEERVERLATELRETIHDEIALSVSIGMGTSKMIARVATKEAKPGRQILVPVGDERTYLAPWPARVLPDAGPQVATRLERLNVQKTGQVADMPAQLLRGLFGARKGSRLHAQSHGIDDRPIEPRKPQQSISRSTSFDPPVSEKPFLRAMLCYLLERACSWLRFHDLATRGMTLTIRYGDYVNADGRETWGQATDDERLLQEAAGERFERLYQRRLPLRFLGVELAPLLPRVLQATLFTDEATERMRRLQAAKDTVRQRFGFTALMTGDALVIGERVDRDRENFRLRTPCLTR